MNIFLDTNTLVADPFFRSFYGSMLLTKAKSSKITLFISEVTYKELIYTISAEIKGNIAQIEKAHANLKTKYNSSFDAPQINIQNLITPLETFYEELFETGILTKLLVHAEDHVTSLEWNISHEAPFFNDKKEEYRDALIWLGIERAITEYELEKNHLVTNNVKDFYAKNKIDLHENLRSRLPNIKLSRNIQELYLKDSELESDKKKGEFKKWYEQKNIQLKNIQEACRLYLKNAVIPLLENELSSIPITKFHPGIELGFVIGEVHTETLRPKEISNIVYHESFADLEILFELTSTIKIHTANLEKRDLSNIETKTVVHFARVHVAYDKEELFKPLERIDLDGVI